MTVRDDMRQRVMRALFVNLDIWIVEAIAIAESEHPRAMALNHARNLLQCRGALSRMLDPDDMPKTPDDLAPAACPPDCPHDRNTCLDHVTAPGKQTGRYTRR